MKEKITKLIDVKSIVTILLVLTLVFIVVWTVVNEGIGGLNDPWVLLFSNVVTMIMTYFFTKKTDGDGK